MFCAYVSFYSLVVRTRITLTLSSVYIVQGMAHFAQLVEILLHKNLYKEW